MDKKKTITRNACAKINLGLDVVGVRGDGYHLLRMIMQQIDLFDTLTFTVTEAQGTGEIRLIDESGLSRVSSREFRLRQGLQAGVRTRRLHLSRSEIFWFRR